MQNAMGRAWTGAQWWIRRFLLGLVLVTVGACTAQFRNHGYVPTDTELAAITVGVDTRESVLAAIGRPSTGGILNESGYYYVASRFRHYGPLEPREISREVLAISFSSAGVLTNIERFGLEDGQIVTLSQRVTDENLRDTTFIRQLMGNLGRFDASQFLRPD